jgi:hypothetical protein
MSVPPDITEEAALRYAGELGWALLPLHQPCKGEAPCTCGHPLCRSVGKHPVAKWVPNGVKGASVDYDTVKEWFSWFRNIGIAMGQPSGVWALDIDDLEELEKLEAIHGKLPLTPVQKTGSGGRHYLFQWSDKLPLANWVKVQGSPIDIRTTGGYIVAAPSLHQSGQRYTWLVDPFTTPVAEAPEWLMEWILTHSQRPSPKKALSSSPTNMTAVNRYAPPLDRAKVIERARKYVEKIPDAVEGQAGSNPTFWAARALLYGFDLAWEEAYPILRQYSDRCLPPWSEKELRHKCEEAISVQFDKPRGWLLQEDRSRAIQAAPGNRTSESGERTNKPNYLDNFIVMGEGENQAECGLAAEVVARALWNQTDQWPRRVGSSLFADSPEGPIWLADTASLFAWIQRQYPGNGLSAIRWKNQGKDITNKSEFHAFLRQCSIVYQAVESHPHEPPIADHFYSHPSYELGNGQALHKVIDYFTPLTAEDRQLILAFVLTLFWGGPYGARPAFLFTGPDGDEGLGRGIGKTTIARHCSRLVGGTFDIRPTDDWNDVMKRLLTDTVCSTQRVILVDNVKTHRFSWADVEALITAERINGRKLYAGDGSRPNTFVVAITLNGASLSKDLAQRCVIVKLGRPQHTGDWESTVTEFIAQNRAAIIADVLALLRGPKETMTTFTRWGHWEREVLARVAEPNGLLQLIQERRRAVDDDEDEAEMLRDAIVHAIRSDGCNPETDTIWIASDFLQSLVARALGEPLSAKKAASKIKDFQGHLTELSISRRETARGWLWKGKSASASKYPHILKKPIF